VKKSTISHLSDLVDLESEPAVREALFWTIVALFVGGHALLLRSAWRLHRSPLAPPPGVPRSDSRADLAWTVATAILTGVMLAFAATTLS
jgi:hypothetical protein